MTIFRTIHNKDNPYLVINTTIATDTRLSFKAKGIWLYAFSRPDDWEFNIEDLINRSQEGRDAIRTGLKELSDCGYLKRTQSRNADGKMAEAKWEFYEIPAQPQTENPSAVEPFSDNPPLLSNESNQVLKKTTTEKQKPRPAAAVVVSFGSLKINEKTAKRIKGKFTQEQIDYAVSVCEAMESRDDDSATLWTALSESWQKRPSKAEKKHTEESFLRSLDKLDGKKTGVIEIRVGPKYINFVAGFKTHAFELGQPNFIQEVQNKLKSHGFII
jgi:hypothetical protein